MTKSLIHYSHLNHGYLFSKTSRAKRSNVGVHIAHKPHVRLH